MTKGMKLDQDALEEAAKVLADGDWRTPPWTMLNTDALNNGYRYDAEQAIRAYLTHAKPTGSAGGVKPLDFSTVLRHAFLSGITAARAIIPGDECDGPKLWTAYEPYEPGAYSRILSALHPASEAQGGWRKITEDDRPPNDIEVLMGCWENWPQQKWIVEYGLYSSTKGGWIDGRMTHWLPSSYLPAAPSQKGPVT